MKKANSSLSRQGLPELFDILSYSACSPALRLREKQPVSPSKSLGAKGCIHITGLSGDTRIEVITLILDGLGISAADDPAWVEDVEGAIYVEVAVSDPWSFRDKSYTADGTVGTVIPLLSRIVIGSRDPIFETGDLPEVASEVAFAPNYDYTPTEQLVFAHLLRAKVRAGEPVEDFLAPGGEETVVGTPPSPVDVGTSPGSAVAGPHGARHSRTGPTPRNVGTPQRSSPSNPSGLLSLGKLAGVQRKPSSAVSPAAAPTLNQVRILARPGPLSSSKGAHPGAGNALSSAAGTYPIRKGDQNQMKPSKETASSTPNGKTNEITPRTHRGSKGKNRARRRRSSSNPNHG